VVEIRLLADRNFAIANVHYFLFVLPFSAPRY
jgi:hypothetical protein